MKLKIVEYLANEVSDDDLFHLWNEYASENNPDAYLFESLEEMQDLLQDDAITFAKRVYFGDVYSWNDSYFYLNGYANIVSIATLTCDKSPISFSDLAQWLIENNRLDDIEF